MKTRQRKRRVKQTWFLPSQSLQFSGRNSPQSNNYLNSDTIENSDVFTKTW